MKNEGKIEEKKGELKRVLAFEIVKNCFPPSPFDRQWAIKIVDSILKIIDEQRCVWTVKSVSNFRDPIKIVYGYGCCDLEWTDKTGQFFRYHHYCPVCGLKIELKKDEKEK